MNGNEIWVGAEPLRRHHVLAAVGPGVRGIDCAQEPQDAVSAACSGGLFSAVVHLRNFDALTAADLARVTAAVRAGAGPVVAECDKLLAAAKRAIGDAFTVHQVTLGRGAAARKELQEIGRLAGVELDAAAADELAARCEGDPGRAVGVLEMLAAAGLDQPGREMVSALLGTASTPGFPWHLLTAIEQGRFDRIGRLLDQVDAIPALGFLSKRTLAAALIAEDPAVEAAVLDRLLGGVTPSAFEQARALASRLGIDGSREMLTVLAEADTAAKRGSPEAGVLLAVGHLARLLGA